MFLEAQSTRGGEDLIESSSCQPATSREMLFDRILSWFDTNQPHVNKEMKQSDIGQIFYSQPKGKLNVFSEKKWK